MPFDVVQKDSFLLARDIVHPPDNPFTLYRRLQLPVPESTPLTLRNRHNFFIRLPEEDRNHARKILLDKSKIYGETCKHKVDLTCDALKLQYKIKNVGKNRSNYKIFSLEGDNDCVLMGKVPDLYDRIVDYFKTMLNIR